jgi:hypothetical protein
MSRLARLTKEFLRKTENHAATEATRLRKSNRGRLRLIGTALGIVVVILVALWLAYHHPEQKLEEGTRYFKEDHLTGADYLSLAPDGTYTVTGREHMGIWAIESGRWRRADKHITFTPDKPDKSPYRGTEIVYRGHAFLSWEDEGSASIIVPIGDTKQSLEEKPESLPPYVFFQIDAKIYQQEVKQTYPFRTLPKMD